MSEMRYSKEEIARMTGAPEDGIDLTSLRVIAQRAKEVCPVDTGQLQTSIRADPDGVVATADYASFVEQGFHHYRNGYIPGRHFLQYAIHDSAPAVNRIAMEHVRAEAEDAEVTSARRTITRLTDTGRELVGRTRLVIEPFTQEPRPRHVGASMGEMMRSARQQTQAATMRHGKHR